MTLKTYEQICILVNAAYYSDEARVQKAGDAIGKRLRTLPEYEKAMRRAGREMDKFLAD